MIHELKTWPEYYSRVIHGFKTVELRKDDRGFQVGDTIVLHEWDPKTEMYTGRSCERLITDTVRGEPWLMDGYVALSIRNNRTYGALERVEGMLAEMDGLYRTVTVSPVGQTWNCEVMDLQNSIAFAEGMPSLHEAVEEAHRQFSEWLNKTGGDGMSGRVLSEEELSAIETALIPSVDRLRMGLDSSGVVNSKTAIPNLIATIRDRDKTIAELKLTQQPIYSRRLLEKQNTLMLSALKQALSFLTDPIGGAEMWFARSDAMRTVIESAIKGGDS